MRPPFLPQGLWETLGQEAVEGGRGKVKDRNVNKGERGPPRLFWDLLPPPDRGKGEKLLRHTEWTGYHVV